MEKSVTVYVPSTAANLGSGFDIIGVALDIPGDLIEVRRNQGGSLALVNCTSVALPEHPHDNVASIAAKQLLSACHCDEGFDLIFHQKIAPGGGLGSSAASAVGAVVAVNHLLGTPFSKQQLMPFALAGEAVAGGEWHADNVAPAMFGGVQFVRSLRPLDLVRMPYPEDLHYVTILPEMTLPTKESRAVLPSEVPLNRVIAQCASFGSLIYGLTQRDSFLVGSAMRDVLIEPHRKRLLPFFEETKRVAIESGAIGVCLSGAGPAILALTNQRPVAHKIEKRCRALYDSLCIRCHIWIAHVDPHGARVQQDKEDR